MFGLFRKKILVEITIFVEKDGEVFYAYSPTLPGFHVEGETEEEVLQNAKDGSIAYLISLIKHNEPLPISKIITETPLNAHIYNFTEQIPAYA